MSPFCREKHQRRNSVPTYTRLHWGKSDRQAPQRIHLLEHHLADVSACFEALLRQPAIRKRLARAGGRHDLDETTAARLCVLAALHDVGKVNTGFQTQIWRPEDLPPQRKRPPRAGHVTDLVPVLEWKDEETADWFLDALGATGIMEWDSDDGSTASGLLIAAFSHHGSPLNRSSDRAANPAAWRPFGGLNPRQCVAHVVQLVRGWFPAAYAPAGAPLPSAPGFQHMFLGLCTLADWLGSDERFFEFCDRPRDDYIVLARERAHSAVSAIGLDVEAQRNALPDLPAFGTLFAIDGHPNAMQKRAADLPLDEPLVIIESETGSGKTEAALWRFARMYAAGLVDGLYFALPTRSAASQIHKRVTDFVGSMFPADHFPEPVLAVPGYLRAGGVEGKQLPHYEVWWDDQHSAAGPVIKRRWAAESAKRYLAAQIAVGTVDQAMMAALQVRHAHMRAACLARNLLVVDEVHASDQYMRVILEGLLDAHIGAGGYACLMSATLGSVARQRFSAPGRLAGGGGVSLHEALEVRYPAITTRGAAGEKVVAVGESGRSKAVRVETLPAMAAFAAAADRGLEAARAGAKVLIVRNTVGFAVRTQQALEERAAPAERHLLFGVDGLLTLHHGRFAAEDRRRLDAAVEAQIGKSRGPGGRVIVGTQTLEQSLDIDADLLITDLCPMDVLLQRIGRLHRHARAGRPADYRSPACLVLMPEDDDLSPWLTRRKDTNGLGPNGFVYEDLRILEATARLVAEHAASGTFWDIPGMNRALVERSTHPEALEAITEAMGEDWREHAIKMEGVYIADNLTARQVIIRRDRSFYEENRDVVFPDVEERVRTRLGDEGVEITLEPAAPSPLAGDGTIPRIVIPGHMAHGLTGEEPVPWTAGEGGFEFTAGDRRFRYDRLGLRQL
ncbi:MAG: CRISPR-associated helicase Cas3' [Caldilineaceae bacterium SB0661_bin_32]|uniref:CRISPR-associated helicase Cas3 n=1 Tax=Caldilineaceae bacterium SB0661_bin_32 TaxID=2605255 RepID=A0A6B1D245_9CHLR|nr:CRISPR-associated helicase Cas3' [Caldilineaceae bacterium SB0661_bin_32]